MSRLTDEESNTQSSGTDEIENYESNDADSLNFDEEEEEDDGSPFPLSCNLSDSIVGGSIVLHIDQTHPIANEPGSGNRLGSFSIPILQGSVTATPFENGEGSVTSNSSGIVPPYLQANQSPSTTASLSDTASENMSTRAVMGDTPSTTTTNGLPLGDDDADNSSQASLADSEADRVRRIHNSIFNSLENDLAELVRIREETIQFLENGTRNNATDDDNSPTNRQIGINNSMEEGNDNNGESMHAGSGGGGDASSRNPGGETGHNVDPFFLRERLTYHSRPFSTFHEAPRGSTSGDTNTIIMNGRSYTPIAKFDNAPPAKPAKPYVHAGPTSCDEKAAAARKILDKLQYGDPEDESACFVRRFWRETSTQDTLPTPAPLPASSMSMDIAAMAERTATLEATLEEAFDSIRLRLQQAAAESSESPSQNPDEQARESNGESNVRNESADGDNTGSCQRVDPNSVPYYQAWDEETSIMNNPLNYDIWNELEDGHDAGPTITARINLAERRTTAVNQIRGNSGRSSAAARATQSRNTNASVGTNNEGAEFDDDSTDDEEISNYFRFRANNIINGCEHGTRNLSLIESMSQESQNFFREIGIPEELGRDLFNMFTFSDDELRIPPEANSALNSQEMPEPLIPRNDFEDNGNNGNNQPDQSAGDGSVLRESQGEERPLNSTGNENDEENDNNNDTPSQLPLVNTESGIRFTINREDDCSTRVYLDENNMNFPYERNDDTVQD